MRRKLTARKGREAVLATQLSGITDGYSGFLPLAGGIEALSVRLLLAGRAQKTIDAQYYLLKMGIVSNAFASLPDDPADTRPALKPA
jgi:hypothetical protein